MTLVLIHLTKAWCFEGRISVSVIRHHLKDLIWSQIILTLSVFGISNTDNPCHNGFIPTDEESENVPFRSD